MNRNTLRRIGAVVVVGALGLAAPSFAALGGPPGSPDNNVTVDQDSFNTGGLPGTETGWNEAPDPDPEVGFGTVALVAGPKTPPSGTGSLRLTTSDPGQLTNVSNASDFGGVPLHDITGAKYSTYVDEDSDAGTGQISLKFNIPGHTLVFEPIYSPEYATDAGAHGAWKTWDAGNASKGWWATPDGSVSACTTGHPCSFAEIKHEVDFGSTVKVNDARLAIGRGPDHFDGNVDLLEVKVGGQTTRYDFESNEVNSDIVTRVDETNGAGWTFEGGTGTSAEGAFDVHYTDGPNLPGGLSGQGSVSLNHKGPGTATAQGSYSAIVQDYLEGNGDATQTYLGSLDNIEAKTYRLSSTSSTKQDYPSVRFEVRLPDPDPTMPFAFTSIVNSPSPLTTGNIDNVSAIHPNASTADTGSWRLTKPVAGLLADTPYTWATIMNSDLRDAVITKALVMAGSSTGNGEFHGGVDLLRFSYRDGSSQTWDFEKAGIPAAPTALVATTGITSTDIALAWTDNANNETGFVLDRSTASSFASVTSRTFGPNVTAYTDTGLASATTYYYRVRAANGFGYSGYSNTVSATTMTNPPPRAPTNLVATAASDSMDIALSWTDNATDETGFVLQRSTNVNFTPATSVTSTTLPPHACPANPDPCPDGATGVTTYTDTDTDGPGPDTGPARDTTYYYRVKAMRLTVSSTYTATATATTRAEVTKPGVTITPPDNSGVFLPSGSPVIKGTATDLIEPGSTGVKRVGIEVRDLFGDVVNWQWVCYDDCTNITGATLRTVNWQATIGLPVNLDHPPAGYTLTAYAFDAAGNIGVSEPVDIVALR